LPCSFAQIAEEQELQNKYKQEGEMGYKTKTSAGHSVRRTSLSQIFCIFSAKKINVFPSSASLLITHISETH